MSSSFGGYSDMQDKAGYLFKVIVVGEQSVGKSSILLQYTKKQFKTEYNVTIGVEFASKQAHIETQDGPQNLTLQIWDTAGQETFKSLVRSFYQKSAAAFIVYNVTKRNSFEQLDNWLEEIKQNAHQDIVTVLIGNKIDNQEEREVTYEEGQQYQQEHDIDLFFETSAKNNINIDQAFQEVSKLVYDKFISNQQFLEKIGQDEGDDSFYSSPEQNSKLKYHNNDSNYNETRPWTDGKQQNISNQKQQKQHLNSTANAKTRAKSSLLENNQNISIKDTQDKKKKKDKCC
ncbi:P-loop containing nucleoside triphosphate hydrolase [Pseudocohnilembus persalinus]|uniref:p-loop containing nucleoside triphosphate hydrolase n=1 Tax=Pseudocohnilembus persalinus TaxID=266149 RepID=A0A0V0QD87_PSEPJ|nr:P-loop containing nucleoside triphosphate hydrolase [Pseudocohnilembus persalinus]|eukprot:KRX00180.1 P-loop containing nucleoside triphosphate hydrolase [Pseudocohnilembus persalinus]